MGQRFRIRWWHLATCVVALLLTTFIVGACAVRAQGRAAYDRAIAQLKAAGKPASIDEYVTSARPVDHALQNDWANWQKAYTTRPSDETVTVVMAKSRADWDAWIAGAGKKPAGLDDLIAESATDFAPALVVLQKGRLELSAWGWIADELPPHKRRMPYATAITLPNMLAVRELAEWLAVAAVCADDPREYLADLDALYFSTTRAGTMIDAMITAHVSLKRDRTYCDLMVMGRLPEDAMQRWLKNPCVTVTLLADAFEGESVLMAMATAVMMDEEPALAGLLPGGSLWRNLRSGSDLWLQGYRDCAIIIEYESHVAQRLRGERPDAWPTWSSIQPRVGFLGAMLLPNMTESVFMALKYDAGHRMTRLAVQVIASSRQHGRLPVDQPELIAWLGTPDLFRPSGDHLHLLYETPAPNRFRLTIDPSSPIPNFDDPAAMAARCKPAGSPPANVPLVWQVGPGPHGQCIEILLPPSGTP